jgi:membrane-associated phospholipid phosphatase
MRHYFVAAALILNGLRTFGQQPVPQTGNVSSFNYDSSIVRQSDIKDSPLATKDSAHYKRAKVLKSFIVPAALIGIGFWANYDGDGDKGDLINRYEIQEERMAHFGSFHTSVDNYLQYAPIAAMYTMDAIGFKGTHDAWNQTALLVKSEIFMTVMVESVKYLTHEERPDGSADNSFPSGHTAQAFLSAEMLRREFGKDHPGVAIGGYLAATAVGAMRILNNKHWVSDVIAGAGFGILSVNIAYLTHQNKWPIWKKKPENLSVMPYYNGSAGGVSAALKF